MTPYATQTVKFDVPIEAWLFTEDMPKTAAPIKRYYIATTQADRIQ
jgi:hypothetical protein